eukprot:symbB.v1.2.007217.t1/scaffold441.1/size205278/4
MPEKVMPLAEPLLKMEKGEVAKVTLDLESGLYQPQEAEEVPEWSGWAWVRSLTLLLAGVVLWIYPERWASVFLLLMALVLSPYLGVSLRGGLALPHVGMRRVIASWLLDFIFGVGSAIKEQEKTWKPKLDEALAADSDFSKGINEYALRIAGNLGQAVLEEKSEWIPPMVDAVGDIVPPALSRVMEKKDDWTPALTTMVGEIVPSVMKGVLSNHHTWSPALMQLVGDVVPPVLSAVLKNREWTPALLEFVGEVVPVVIAVVLQRPELPPAIAGFIDGAGPSLAPAVVRLIDHIIMDPKLMESIRKMTDDSMRDEALVKNIKDVIESSLKEGTMYRAVGHGVLKAAGQNGGDPFQTPGGDPWAAIAGPKQKGRANAERRPEARHSTAKGNRGSKGGGKAGGKAVFKDGLREDQRQRLEAWIEENMNDILAAGFCPRATHLLEGAMLQVPEAQRQSPELDQLVRLELAELEIHSLRAEVVQLEGRVLELEGQQVVGQSRAESEFEVVSVAESYPVLPVQSLPVAAAAALPPGLPPDRVEAAYKIGQFLRRCLSSHCCGSRRMRASQSPSVSEEAEQEEVPETPSLRNSLVVSGGEGCVESYGIGCLELESLPLTIAIIAVAVVDGRVLVALPDEAWARRRQSRRLPSGALKRATSLKVSSCGLGDRSTPSQTPDLKIWVGLLDPELEGAVSYDSELPEIDFPGADEQQQVPYAPALVAVCQDHFTFFTAESQVPHPPGLSPLEMRMNKLEELMLEVRQSLRPPSIQANPKPAVTRPSALKKSPKDAPQQRTPAGAVPSNLDAAVVQQALQSGVSPEVLREMAGIVGPQGVRERMTTGPSTAAANNEADEEDSAEEDPGGGGAAEPSDPMQVAVLQLSKLMGQLGEEKIRRKDRSLESLLDGAEGHGSAKELGGYARSRAAALRELQKCLKKQPQLIYKSVEQRMLEDWEDAGSLPGISQRNMTARGWLEHRSCIQQFPASIRSGWAIAGILDCLRGGRVEEARARAGLALAQLDQQAIDRGNFLLASELKRSAIFRFQRPLPSRDLGGPSQQVGGPSMDGSLHAQTSRSGRLSGEEVEAVRSPQARGCSRQDPEAASTWQGEGKRKRWKGRQGGAGSSRCRLDYETMKGSGARHDPGWIAPDPCKYRVPGADAPVSNILRIWHPLLRWILDARTTFATFLHSVKCNRPSKEEGTARTIWPMPPPFPRRMGFNEAFDKDADNKEVAVQKGLNLVVLMLSWLHLYQPAVAPRTLRLGRALSPAQWRVVRRLKPFLEEVGDFGDVGPEEMGRTASKMEGLDGQLAALHEFAANSGLTRAAVGYLGRDLRHGQHEASEMKQGAELDAGEVIGSYKGAELIVAKEIEPERLSFPADRPHFNPKKYLDEIHQQCYEDPASLADSGAVEQLQPPRVQIRASRQRSKELLRFLDRHHRLALAPAEKINTKLCCGAFSLIKDSKKDRLIVDARPPNLVEPTLTSWCKTLGAVSAVLQIELRPNHQLYMWGTDLRDYYYCFSVSDKRCMRNSLQMPISESFAKELHCYDPKAHGTAPLFPCLQTLAMGDNNAVELGQMAHVNLGISARAFSAHELLTSHSRGPRGDISAGVVIDDVLIAEQLEPQAAEGVRRRMLSLLQHIYSAQVGRQRSDILRLSLPLIAELWSLVILGPIAVADLRAQTLPKIYLSDASSGCVAVVASPTSVEFGRELHRHCLARGSWSKLLSPWKSYLREHDDLELCDEIPDGVPLVCHPVWVSLAEYLQYKVTLMKKITRRQHINLLELEAVLLLEARLAERGGDLRYLLGSDSQVTLAALLKGRSSSWALNRKLRASLCYHLGGGLYGSYGFVPSLSNVGDDPTRGKPVRAALEPIPEWLDAAIAGSFEKMDKWLAELGYDPLSVAQLPFDVNQKSVEAMVSHIAHLRSVQKPERLVAFDRKAAEPLSSGSSQRPLDSIVEDSFSPFCIERSEEVSREPKQEKSLDDEKTDKRGTKIREEKPTQAVVSHTKRRVAPPASEQKSAPALPETSEPFTARFSHGRRQMRRLRFNAGAAALTDEAKLLLAKYPAAQFFGPDGKRCHDGFVPKQRGFLDLYSGAAGVARALATRYGVWVLSFEYEHCPSEDLLEPSTQDHILAMIEAGCFYGVGAAPECCSFSRAITPAVRSRERPRGLPNVSQNMKRKIKVGNLHSDFIYRVVACCRHRGVGYFVENPDSSFLWLQPAWVASGWALMENSYRLDQCRYEAAWRKRTRLATNLSFAGRRDLCLGGHTHIILRGRSSHHRLNWTRVAQAYPKKLCLEVAKALGGFADLKPVDPRRNRLDCAACSRSPGLVTLVLQKYGMVLYSEGHAIYEFRHLLVLAQQKMPLIKPSISAAWQLLTKWESLQPLVHRLPLPEVLYKAMISVASMWNWKRWCATLVMVYEGIGRIGEAMRALRRDLALPSDNFVSDHLVAYMKVSQPKTRRRGRGKVQHLRIENEAAVLYMEKIFADLHPSCKLYPLSAAAFRSRWDKVLDALGVPRTDRPTPSSVRGGGAILAYRRGEAIGNIMWKMRISHQATLEAYLQETALWQFLLSIRSLCSVWSVRDAERAFVASSFVKKAYDVAEWGSLRLGPSLSSHPMWFEVFPEFQVPQYKWPTHRTDPQPLMDGVTALELLFQHRVDSSGLNGGIDFRKEIKFEDFEQWLYSKEILLEERGVCINKHKFGLIMGSMNAALEQQHRLQQQAEKQYLEKLLEVAEQEVDNIARDGADGEDEAAFLDFQSRWRRRARSQSAVKLAFELCLWAKHKLGCEAAPLKPMAMTLAVELKVAEGEPRSHAADTAGKMTGGSLSISPVELEDKVRRQLQDADGKALGLAGLARLERQSLGVGASMEDLLPGEGTFLNFLVSKPQLREMVENHMEAQKEKVAGLGSGEVAEEVNVADMLRKADEALLELRPKSSLLDVHVTAHVEQKLRAAGLMSSFTELLVAARRGAGMRSNFGSGWALAVQDVKAYDLLQSHANFVLRSCGADVVHHHFGVGSAACALGLPPVPGSATPPQQSTLETGLHFEAAVKPSQPESLASSEAAAASKAAEAMVAFKRSSDFFQDLEDSYGGHVGGRQATTQQALDALASVDFLEDVESSTSWQALYGPSLGALEDFLCQAGPEQLQKHHLRFLVLAPGSLPCVSLAPRLMRLPTAVSVEALEMAVAGGQAKTAAAQLTSLCIDEPQNAEG